MKAKRPALPGERFGRLVVSEIVGGKRRCRCDCGAEAVIDTCNLTSGNSTSCGCFRRELLLVKNTKHGASTQGRWTPTYRSWHGIIQRCCNPRNPSYPRYGGRGIRLCESWRESFGAFLKDMGERPANCSIERVNNDGDYTKDNCVWATEKEQQRNKRSNRVIAFRGRKQTLAAWAEELGIPYWTLHARFRRRWRVERALTEGVEEAAHAD